MTVYPAEQGTFEFLPSLLTLDVSRNSLVDINGILTKNPVLTRFDASENLLPWFDYAFVPGSVEWLNIRANNIDSLGNYFDIGENSRLQ